MQSTVSGRIIRAGVTESHVQCTGLNYEHSFCTVSRSLRSAGHSTYFRPHINAGVAPCACDVMCHPSLITAAIQRTAPLLHLTARVARY